MIIFILSFLMNYSTYALTECEQVCVVKHLECSETAVGEFHPPIDPKLEAPQPASKQKKVKKKDRGPDNFDEGFTRQLASAPPAVEDICDSRHKTCMEECNESN